MVGRTAMLKAAAIAGLVALDSGSGVWPDAFDIY
jgi:hypothetical protein